MGVGVSAARRGGKEPGIGRGGGAADGSEGAVRGEWGVGGMLPRRGGGGLTGGAHGHKLPPIGK